MKHEALPTCPICSATMEESSKRLIAVDYCCLNCGFTTDIDAPIAALEESIINGDFDEEDIYEI